MLPFLLWDVIYTVKNVLFGDNVEWKNVLFDFLTGRAAAPLYYILVLFQRNRQISRRIKKHLWLSNRSWARDVHSFGILHSWGALAGKSCSAQASSIWLIAGAFRRTQSK